MTNQQEKLAELLFTTKIIAPVGRRQTLLNGSYKLYKKERPTSPIDFAQTDEEFALKLHETKPDAPLSPIYINLRNLPETVLNRVGVVLSEMRTEVKPDVISGIPKAGTPLADTYSRRSGIPQVDIFAKEETPEGRKIIAKKTGKSSGQKLRLIDDLATKGDTKLEAVKAAQETGYEVIDILVLVDRQQGGIEQVQKAGYIMRAAFTLDDLLGYGLRTGKISKEQYDKVIAYLHTHV